MKPPLYKMCCIPARGRHGFTAAANCNMKKHKQRLQQLRIYRTQCSMKPCCRETYVMQKHPDATSHLLVRERIFVVVHAKLPTKPCMHMTHIYSLPTWTPNFTQLPIFYIHSTQKILEPCLIRSFPPFLYYAPASRDPARSPNCVQVCW